MRLVVNWQKYKIIEEKCLSATYITVFLKGQFLV